MNTVLIEASLTDQINRISQQDSPQVIRYLLNKVSYDVDVLRNGGCARQTILDFEAQLMDIEHRLYKPESPPKPEPQVDVLNELNSLPSEQLRHRKKTKLEVNEEIHTDLSADLVEMVQKIRKNAEIFNEKLTIDRSVVDTAADALQNASSNMSTVGARLQKYRKTSALGWWFYIYATLFIVGSVVAGMILIQLFPKF